LDLNEFPLNPLAGWNTLYAGIDMARAFRVLLRERHVNAVLCIFENAALALLMFRRVLRFNAPVLLLEVSGRGWRPRDAMLDFVMPRIDQVLTLTVASKQYAEREYKLKRPAIVVGYAVDEAFFRPTAPLSKDARATNDYILAVGSDHTRDYDLLLQACAPLDVELLIRTDLPISIPQECRGKVQVIDRVSYKGLRDLYKQARLVALPLRNADNPGGITTLFESMAMAKPVVCSNTGATRDIILQSRNGISVPPGDIHAMRHAICWLLDHPNAAAEFGRSARSSIEQSYSMSHRAVRIAAAIRDIVAELCQ
jgi:glycosyltransferase involved in cell wall biosynthesis